MRIREAYGDDDPALQVKPFPTPRPVDELHWNDTGIVGVPNYYAYLVRFESIRGNLLTFHFLSVADAGDIAGSFTINLTDAALVWNALPSTVPDAQIDEGQECGFLFLSHETMEKREDMTMIAAANASGGGTGKIPKTG
ncbi:MAG: hypothetical protein U0359_04880 [Byssovorax sp.]